MTTIPTFDFTLSGETWRAVPDAVGNFVSDHGRSASYRPAGRDDRGRPTGWKRLLKAQPGVGGYIRHAMGGRVLYLHHLVAAAFLPPSPSPDHEITFLDEDCTNCRPENLIWMTAIERIAMRRAAGTWTPDKTISAAVLTPDDVREVRRDLAAGMTGAAIAEKFGVTPPAISHIKSGHTWTHIQ